MRVALAVIAGSNAIEEGIGRMLESVYGKVDGVFIAYTGSSDGTTEGDVETFNKIDEDFFDAEKIDHGALVPIGWDDDFSLARNASFELIKRDEKMYPNDPPWDWILWLDCDDVIPEDVDIRQACEQISRKGAHGAFAEYQYQIDDAGTTLVSHLKERLFRADIEWNWEYPIHENCTGPMGTRMMTLTPRQMTVQHLRADADPKRERNSRIVAQWFKEKGDSEPRAVMFMAHETVAMAETRTSPADKIALLQTALKLYRRFIEISPPNDDVYTCNRQSADILVQFGRYDDAINLDLQGIKMHPQKVASFVGIASTYLAAEQWQEAATWGKLALEASSMKEGHHDSAGFGADIKLEHFYKPLMIVARALGELGDFEMAFSYARQALDLYSDQFTRDFIEDLKKRRSIYRNDRITGAQTNRERFRNSKPEKSICIFVPPGAEDWNLDKLKNDGLGGTETSIIKLALHMAKVGWRVAIFGAPGDWEDRISYNEYENGGQVEWYRAGQWHPDEKFTVFIGLRVPEIFDAPINADLKILWAHDINMGPTRYGNYGDRFSRVDAIVAPSPFHMRHLFRVYGGQQEPWTANNEIIFNGFDYELFRDGIGPTLKRDPKRIMYASSPDRGLPRLLDLWPRIAQRQPNACLNIYYGWDSIDAIIAGDGPTAPQLAHFKQKTQAKIESLQSAGHQIFEYGRISETRLARHMHRTGIMAYPANFMETFGIVFAQAMAAGVVPVVPDLGFLPDLVSDAGLVVSGAAPDSMVFGDRFVDAVIDGMDPPKNQRSLISGRVAHLDWKNVGEVWEKVINRYLDNISVKVIK